MPSTGLILDALNPPSPTELVADLEQVGAVGFAFYVLRRSADGGLLDNGTVTKAHIDAVQESGRFAFPICVPGNNPQPDDAKRAIDNALAMDVDTWLMIFDLESFSFPPHQWLADAIVTCHHNTWMAGKYGDTNVVVQYVLSDGDWFSHGRITVRRNQLQPIPALPVDGIGDQYTVGVIWNGHEYDGSVFDLDFLTAATHGPGPTDNPPSSNDGGERRKSMTREGWAALFRFMFALLMRNPGDTGLKDPVSGKTYWEHYYWADRMLAENPDLVMVDFLVSASTQEAVTLPLKPQPGPQGPPGPNVLPQVVTALEAAVTALRDTQQPTIDTQQPTIG